MQRDKIVEEICHSTESKRLYRTKNNPDNENKNNQKESPQKNEPIPENTSQQPSKDKTLSNIEITPTASQKDNKRSYLKDVSPAKPERPKYNDALWLGNLITYGKEFSSTPEKTKEFEKRAEKLYEKKINGYINKIKQSILCVRYI